MHKGNIGEGGARRRGRRLVLLAGSVFALSVVAAAAAFFLAADIVVGLAAAALFFFLGSVAVAGLLYARHLLRATCEENELFARAFETLSDPRLIVGPGDRALFANSAFQRRFCPGQRSPLAALKEGLSGAGESAREFDRLRAAAAQGSRAAAEIRVEAEGGGWEWLRVSVGPITGRPGYSLWIVEDVTSRHEIQQIIHEEQEKLIDYLDHAPVGFYSVDREGRFLFVNRTLADWLGRTPEEMVGSGLLLGNFLAAEPEPGSASGAEAFDPLDWSNGSNQGETRLRNRRGRVFPVTITQSLARDTGDQGFRTRSVVRDLSSEREMERALQRSERRFHGIFEGAPIGIALVDTEGRVVECNPVFHQIVDGKEADIRGLPVVDTIAAEDREEVYKRLSRLATGGEVAGPIEVRLNSGNERVASLYASRVEEGEGADSGLLLHLLEVTEQKKLEVRFAQSQKVQAVGQLAGGIAHDFNNLLTAMIGFCDLLLLRHRPGDPSFADIMQVKQNASRAANLVRQLLAFSRQQTLVPRVLDVTDVLAELSNLLRRLIGESIELRLIHGEDLGPVEVDQGQFEQVIINLVVNARDAMAQGGILTVRTANVSSTAPFGKGLESMPPGDYVSVEVSDTGDGIPKENLERIFDPFFSTKEVGSGTGLGLSTVYGIVKQTGGFVFVDSEPGKGSVFRIFLPRYRGQGSGEEETAPATRAAGEADLTGAGTVLLVEDEDAVRLFGARALRNKGYRVLEARTGEGALEILSSTDETVSVLITDVVMPEMDGPTLVRRVRRSYPDIRVIFISGYAEEDLCRRIDESSGVHFLSKPFTLHQLAGKVKEVTSRAA
jgi:two-component system cell cycle sensor histidine kinase/response regulator CckA